MCKFKEGQRVKYIGKTNRCIRYGTCGIVEWVCVSRFYRYEISVVFGDKRAFFHECCFHKKDLCGFDKLVIVNGYEWEDL